MPKYWSLLEQILDEAINLRYEARKARRKNKVKFAASNAGFCKRATILNRINAKEDDIDPRTKRVFWIGEIFHDAIVNLLRTVSGRLVAAEEYVGKYEDDIGAKFDFILRDDNGLNELNELKTVTDGGIWAKILKAKKPDHHHVFQALTYWIKNKKYRVDKLVISYISKESAILKVFRVNVTDALLKEVNDWWDNIREAYNRKWLPPPLDEKSVEYKKFCNSCTYRNKYCFGDPIEMEENIRELVWDNAKKLETK